MNKQWQTYKELELIPATVSEPQFNSSLVARFGRRWRSLVDAAAEKLSFDQQHELLEKCWSIIQPTTNRNPSIWRMLWFILNQPISAIFTDSYSRSLEPKIEQVLDQDGNPWWCAHDPRTGQTIYLCSEEEIQIWLKKRFYR